MINANRAFPLLVFALCCTTQGGNYLVEDAGWLGNTWNGNTNQWVQHNAADIYVYGGRIFTNSRWDENKRNSGIYSTVDGTPLEELDNVHNGGGKVPGPAVTAGPTYTFASWAIHHEKRSNNRAWYGVARCFHDGSAAPFGDSHILIIHELDQTAVDMESRVSGLAVCSRDGIDKLYVSDPIDSAIRVYDVAGMQFIRSFPVSGDPGDLCFDAAGHLWVIDRSSHIVKKYSRNGIDLKRDITDTKMPVDICSDATTGNLVVADGHHSRQHLRFYDVSDDPVVKSTWGESVLTNPQAGSVKQGTFFGITAVSIDSSGNRYISTHGMGAQGTLPDHHGGFGLKIFKYDNTGTMIWNIANLEFLDCGDIDPGHESSVYTRDSRYEIDWTTAPVQGRHHAAWTIDPVRYPNDPRLSISFTVEVVRLEEMPFLFMRPQNLAKHGEKITPLYRLDGTIAVPAVVFSTFPGILPNAPDSTCWYWIDRNGDGDMQKDEYTGWSPPGGHNRAVEIDASGNTWFGGYGSLTIAQFEFAGLDNNGVPQYNIPVETTLPSGITSTPQTLNRLVVDAESNSAVVSVYTDKHPNPPTKGGKKGLGSTLARFSDWNGARRFEWETVLPLPESYNGTVAKYGSSLDVVGEYIFVGLGKSCLKVDVYRLHDGSFVGTLYRGDHNLQWTGEACGYYDMQYAIQAHLLTSGEYVVIGEEDARGKNIVFQWCPEGNCSASSLLTPRYPARRTTRFARSRIYSLNGRYVGESAVSGGFPLRGKVCFPLASGMWFVGGKKRM